MRILRINNTVVDLDDETAIGIDFQAYDITDPANRKTNVSNSFTVPITKNNSLLFGWANDSQTTDKTIYSIMTCDYWNDNIQLIKNGTARITEIGKRITILITQKSTIWENLKNYKWNDFVLEFIDWMATEKGLPVFGSHSTQSYSDFLNTYINATDGIVLNAYLGNLVLYSTPETSSTLYLKNEIALGGHFSIYFKSIFEFLEYKYSVDLGTQSTEQGNIFIDAVASSMFIPARRISIKYHFTGQNVTGYFFEFDTDNNFLPHTDAVDKADKTLYDVTKGFCQHLNCLVETIDTDVYFISKFDEIGSAPIVELSGYVQEISNYIPTIDKYDQNNYIKFSKRDKATSDLVNSKFLECKNRNINIGDSTKSLFQIEGYIPSFVDGKPYLAEKETFETMQYFVSGENSQVTIKYIDSGVESSAVFTVPKAQLYDLSGEYLQLAKMIEYPDVRIVKKWFTLVEIANIRFFRRYFINQLNGFYFLNKISGFNPEKSKEATQIELIKLG